MMPRLTSLLAAAFAVTLSTAPAQNLIINGSFENLTPYLEDLLLHSTRADIPPSDPTDAGTNFLPGWENPHIGVSVVSNGNSPDGNNHISAGWKFNGLTYSVGILAGTVLLEAGVTYQFSFDHLVPDYASPYSRKRHILNLAFVQTNVVINEPMYSAQATYFVAEQRLFEQEKLILPIGAGFPTTLYESNVETALQDIPLGWTTRTFEFTPLVSDVYRFNIRPGGTSGNYDSIAYDNISLIAVPEPHSVGLLGLGLAGLLVWSWSRRKTDHRARLSPARPGQRNAQSLRHWSLPAALLLATTLPLPAQNLIINGSFEQLSPYLEAMLESSSPTDVPNGDPTDPDTNYLPGWLVGQQTTRISSAGGTDGQNVLLLERNGNVVPSRYVYGYVQQTLILDAGVAYQFTFDQQVQAGSVQFAHMPSLGNKEAFRFSFISENHTDTFSVAYNTIDANGTINRNNIVEEFTLGSATAGWVTRSFAFTAQTSGTYDFRFQAVGNFNNAYPSSHLTLDNFSLTAVPEPSAALLLGAGLLGLAAWSHRRRFTRSRSA